MGKTRRKQKNVFDDEDLRIEDLFDYANTTIKAGNKRGQKKHNECWEDEYFDYLEDRIQDPAKEEEVDD